MGTRNTTPTSPATGGTNVTAAPLQQLVVNNGIALKRCALDGDGIVLLSDWLVGDELHSGELVQVLGDYEATPTTFETAIWLIYPSRAYVPRKVTAFVDFLERRLDGHRAAGT